MESSDIPKKTIVERMCELLQQDPIKILRLAYAVASNPKLNIAPDVFKCCQELVNDGKLDTFDPEIAWHELSIGLMSSKPSRMFEFLRTTGALVKLMPELNNLFGVPQPVDHHPEGDAWTHTMMVIDQAATENATLEVRWASLLHDLGKGITPVNNWPKHHGHEKLGESLVKDVCFRLRVPAACRELAIIAVKHHGLVHRTSELKASTIVKFFKGVDAFRRPDRFFDLLTVCQCDARGRLGRENDTYAPMIILKEALSRARAIDAGKIAASCTNTIAIKNKIHSARVSAIKNQVIA